VLAEAARAGDTLECDGGGASAPWAPGRGSAKIVLDTTSLREPLIHEAGDLTALAGAGVPICELQAMLARGGQRLALDPPSALYGATLGGVMSSGDAGPLRHRYGTLRDLVIGITVVLSDGTVARSGGRVIKNVAGYDLAKLFCSAHGSLGLVVDMWLRLHPVPEGRWTVRVGGSAAEACDLVLAVLASPLEPSSLDFWQGSSWARFEGTVEGALAQAEGAVRLARGRGLEAEVLGGGEDVAAWEQVGQATWGGAIAEHDAVTVLRAVTLPSQLTAADSALQNCGLAAGVKVELASHAGIGVHTARLIGGDAAAHAMVLESWRASIARLGGSVSVREHPPELDDPVLLAGPPPPGVEVMSRVKQVFDPERRLAPGRFAPWF
jgi:glycolate oxidase FAD binding subunit